MLVSESIEKAEETVAGPTRLELATSGVTGRRSNQLNYDPTRGIGLYCTRTVTGYVSDEGNGVPARVVKHTHRPLLSRI